MTVADVKQQRQDALAQLRRHGGECGCRSCERARRIILLARQETARPDEYAAAWADGETREHNRKAEG